MTDPSAGHRFDEEEVALILRRAGEMQAARTESGGSGMTLAELEEIAREAGIDPALVRQAAADVRSGAAQPPAAGSRFLGAPSRLREERVVPREVSPAEHELLVDEIRRALDDAGLVGTVGRTLTWHSSREGGAGWRRIDVTVTSRDGQTTIRVTENCDMLSGVIFGPLMAVLGVAAGGGVSMGIGLGALHSGLVAAVGLWSVWLGGTYLLARTIYGSVVRRHALALASLADRLAEVAGSPEGEVR
jgi:hypothetical protein